MLESSHYLIEGARSWATQNMGRFCVASVSQMDQNPEWVFIETINKFGKTNVSLMRCGWPKYRETLVCSLSKNHFDLRQ